ncbi:3-oxoacyl-[acyl-carrier-protein] synthase III C-terminal domain-containing protein [Streptomyces sp. NBC_01092]|uniref:3-oxoacyl-[acyl-carrier-protein] synthase III C-terminal domain-containing protein n=1 Tax=Streptomyces sp. NBC_01092 TaxID=2903748 RepID=UPI00386EBAC6|nr:3-oxoacyl-ACP synthase [Streptomyces sp. NBC_01092]
MAGILDRAGADAFTQRMFTGVFKLRESPSWAPDDKLDDLLADVGQRALGGTKADLILYGHTLSAQEVTFRPGFVQRIRERLCLEQTVPFLGISGVGCASMLRSIEVARDYLRSSSSDSGVLVLGADMGSAIEACRIVPQMTIMGDSAGAMMVRRSGFRYRYLGGAARKDLRFHKGMRMTLDECRTFARVCTGLVVTAVEDATRQAGLSLGDLDWVMPHLANAMFWSSFCQASGIPHERVVLDLLPTDGHTFGLDALKSLNHADEAGRLSEGDRCALISVGQGSYIQVIVVEVVSEA